MFTFCLFILFLCAPVSLVNAMDGPPHQVLMSDSVTVLQSAVSLVCGFCKLPLDHYQMENPPVVMHYIMQADGSKTCHCAHKNCFECALNGGCLECPLCDNHFKIVTKESLYTMVSDKLLKYTEAGYLAVLGGIILWYCGSYTYITFTHLQDVSLFSKICGPLSIFSLPGALWCFCAGLGRICEGARSCSCCENDDDDSDDAPLVVDNGLSDDDHED